MSLDSQAIILAAGPNGLGAIRSLNLEGISHDVIAATPDDVVLSSRLPIRKVALQKNKNEQELLSILLNWPKSNLVLIPTSDWYVNFLSKNQQILTEKFSFVIPNGDLSDQLIDKQKEVELVKNLVTLPKSLLILPDSAEQLLANISLPIIIKPRSNEMNYIGQKNIQIYNDIELNSFYQTFTNKLQYCIAQEIIVGDDANLWVCNCTFDLKGKLINAFTFQRLQLSPPHFGVTSYAISRPNPEIIEQVAKLGQGLNYVGSAMVEFKLDDRDGQYKYIEINPRLGLCNYFDTSCDKNNVYASFCVAKSLPFNEKEQINQRMFLSLYEDLFSRYKDKQDSLSIFKTYFSNLLKPHTFIYFAWCDPKPAFYMFTKQFKAMITSLKRKIT